MAKLRKLEDYTPEALKRRLDEESGYGGRYVYAKSDLVYHTNYERCDYSYGVTRISYNLVNKPKMHVIAGVITFGMSVPCTLLADALQRSKYAQTSHYFYTQSGDELGTSRNEAAEKANDIGQTLMREEKYSEAKSYFNVAYNLCEENYRNEGQYKLNRDNASECDERAKKERERIEREERERIERERFQRMERERIERERIQREKRQKLEREERERIEREKKEKIEREKKERIEREKKERIERERKERIERQEKERIEREDKERDQKKEDETLKNQPKKLIKNEANGNENGVNDLANNNLQNTQKQAEGIYRRGRNLWNEAFDAEIRGNAEAAKSKFQESKRLFCEAAALNSNNQKYKNWIVICELKLEGNDLFNEAVALQEEAARLSRRQQYEEARRMYERAKEKFQEGLDKSNDERFRGCIEIVEECIREMSEAEFCEDLRNVSMEESSESNAQSARNARVDRSDVVYVVDEFVNSSSRR